MLKELRRTAEDASGFTLIELLIVVVIIGILAAIAIPQFTSTKESAYEATVKSDLRNGMTTLETEYASNQSYPSSASGLLNLSDNVSIVTYDWVSSTPDAYCLELGHSQLDNDWAVTNDTSVHGNFDTPGTPEESTDCS